MAEKKNADDKKADKKSDKKTVRVTQVASPAGAGDAVVAGLAAGLARKEPFEFGLRLGFAAAGAVVMMPGTADCHRQDIDTLFPNVELIPLL